MADAIKCKVEGCERDRDANGMCAMHNVRVWRNGHTDLLPKKPPHPCAADGCDRVSVAKGWCHKHWVRVQKWGDPDVVRKGGKKRSGATALNASGYEIVYEPEHPLAMVSGQVLVHRKVLWEKLGPGSHPCDICGVSLEWTHDDQRVRLAVDHIDNDILNNDPANLRATCQPCNVRRPSQRRTACNAGHDYTPENTYVDPNGSRRCRTCMREWDRRRNLKRRGKR